MVGATPSMLTLNALAIELGRALKARGLMIAVAESCTGGMVAEAITSVAGSSIWFDRGFITYSNAAKIEMLGVSSQTLAKFGAVSEEVAAEMASGCLQVCGLKNSHAQIAGSITGVAGPDGGSAEKPVGTVCFSWVSNDKPTQSTTKSFQGDRKEVRQQATAFLMATLIDELTVTR